MSKLISISIKQDDFNLPTPEVLQEQNLAIYDLTQSNSFQLIGFESYDEIKLDISLSGNSLVFENNVKGKMNEAFINIHCHPDRVNQLDWLHFRKEQHDI